MEVCCLRRRRIWSALELMSWRRWLLRAICAELLRGLGSGGADSVRAREAFGRGRWTSGQAQAWLDLRARSWVVTAAMLAAGLCRR